MKKNYLLLFLIALLFGTATMRGQSVPFDKITEGTNYIVKIGNGYLKLTNEEVKCITDKETATRTNIAKDTGKHYISISANEAGIKMSLLYYRGNITTDLLQSSDFRFVEDNQKYYLQAPAGKGSRNKFVTNKNGVLTLETEKSNDALIEISKYSVGNDFSKAGKPLHEALALLQFHHEETPLTPTSPGKITRKNGPFIGSGLGQYDISAIDNVTWTEVADKMFRGANNPDNYYNQDNIIMHKDAISGLKITTVTPGYVYVTTKSKFEDAVRENTKVPGYSNTPINTLVPEHDAKYLKATATGYELTTNKAEASVFYFDGNHLTGLDYGFGLNNTQYKYDLTADAQKAVVAKGKLEKTLDAGSYSLKVGDKFVKLDNSGLSVTDNESESHIFLEEATEFKLNTDKLGYVTFFAPTAVEILDNVEVYTGKLNAQNSVVNLKKVNTKKIPEKTAVLLRKGTSKTSFTVKKIASAPAITDNSLKGYTVSSNQRVANAYGFAVQGNKLVFIPLTDGVRAFKAVIFNGNAAGMQEFIPTSFAPTGIEGVTVEENKEEIFDLTGRRVESPVKGQIYVKGGKKFIQK